MVSEVAQLLKEMSDFYYVYIVGFRLIAGFLTGCAFSLGAGLVFLRNAALFRAPVRKDTPESHQAKNYTPTMGGIIILVSVLGSSLIWCTFTPEVWIFLSCLIGFGLIGLWDDLSKLYYSKGIAEKHKFAAQIFIASLIVFLWYFLLEPSTALSFPFFKELLPHLGLALIPWALFILVGTSNAVNLTDGLDGLAASSLIVSYASFSLICLLAGHSVSAFYLAIPFTPTLEIAVLGSIMVGALIGFLWYNSHPAQLFMGDVGSLPLGSCLALMALMARQELLLPLIGCVFVAETLSVIAQVTSFKLFGKRIFKMAPFHHHFELSGMHEAKITTRCVLITTVLSILTLMLFIYY